MHYQPMRPRRSRRRIHHAHVEWGWLMPLLHSTGASLFFIVVYLTCSALMYGSYQKRASWVDFFSSAC